VSSTQACALIPGVPTLPSIVVNVAIGIRVEGPGISIRSRGLRGINRGGHLLSLGIAVVTGAMMRDGLMSAVLIVAVAVAVGMAITLMAIVIMAGCGTNRSGRGVGSFETPGHELTALPIIDFSFWSTPDSNYSRVVLPEVTLHAFVDTHTAEKNQR